MSTANVVHGLRTFLDNCPSPYHVVASACQMLEAAGYTQLHETSTEGWNKILPGSKHYLVRNSSSILAFYVGKKFSKKGPYSALKIVAAHTDSPCLRVKPCSRRPVCDGLVQMGVETYGGGLWHTWFDRDLSLAGRLIYQDENSKLIESLVNINKPILRIPNLAIHLDRSARESGFAPNTEAHIRPILCSADFGSLCTNQVSINDSLMEELLKSTKIDDAHKFLSFDLCLYDTQKATLSGLHEEFIQSARLDNLFMSYTSLMALIDTGKSCELLDKLEDINMVALFDHEEVGSCSSSGADSTFIRSMIRKIIASIDEPGNNCILEEIIISRSFLISADMAHAVHPNYPEKHEENHRPKMGGGIVIKYNGNQRYATSSKSSAFIKALAHNSHLPIQEFCVRNDIPCGSTVGPILASNLGIETVDIGIAQLSMHSIREMAAVSDIKNSIDTLSTFLRLENMASRLS